jgi:hypothetical protein
MARGTRRLSTCNVGAEGSSRGESIAHEWLLLDWIELALRGWSSLVGRLLPFDLQMYDDGQLGSGSTSTVG